MAVGNITYQKAYRKQQKKSYRGLTDNQRKYIKATGNMESILNMKTNN
jgi:hypothetical protein